MSTDMLTTVIRELTLIAASMRKWNERISYRLHPNDFETVKNQAKKFCYQNQQEFIGNDTLYIMGVRIFKDEKAPKVEMPTASPRAPETPSQTPAE